MEMHTSVESALALGDMALTWVPELPADAIERPHLIATVEAAAENTPVLFIEGTDGEGITTFLTQFARKHSGNVISLFIKPASRFSYGVDYLRRLVVEQYLWHTKKQVLDPDVQSPDLLAGLALKMRQQARRQPVYFVVDGVHQIPPDDRRYVEEIFRDVLPIGVSGFKFIIAGRRSDLAVHLRKETSATYQILKFSDHESRFFLNELDLSPSELEEILKVANGNVGKLASVKRLVQSGTSWKSLSSANLSSYPDFIKEEFRGLGALRPEERLAIAVIAHSRQPMNAAEVAAVVPTLSELEVIGLLGKCIFIHVDRDTSAINFTSEKHRRYAEKELESLRRECSNLHIDYLLQNPSSNAALRFLPYYFQQVNNTEALVKIISDPKHYVDLLAETQSLSALQAHAALAAKSAKELTRIGEILQFTIQKSLFRSLGAAGDYPSEISALVALGQSQRALDVASRSRTREDRLVLISQYAKRVKESGSSVDPDVHSYIKEIVGQIDFQGWGESAIPVAESLLAIDVDLALSIVDSAMESDGKKAKSDRIYASLAMGASASSATDTGTVSEKVGQKISNDDLRNLVTTVASMFSRFSADEVIKLVEKLKIERKIYLLRTVASASANRDGVMVVVEYALAEMSNAAAYRPKAGDLADLATPLAFAPSEEILAGIRRFESHLALVDLSTSSVDYTRLQMRLAHAESRVDVSAACRRLEAAVAFAIGVASHQTQALCLAEILSSTAAMSDGPVYEACDEIAERVTSLINEKLSFLLSNTASHGDIFVPVLSSLCIRHPALALGVVGMFNTIRAKDVGYLRVCMETAKQPLDAERSGIILSAVGRLSEVYRSGAISVVLEMLSRQPTKDGHSSLVGRLLGLAKNPAIAARAIIVDIDAMDASSQIDFSGVLSRFYSLWDLIDDPVVKIDLSFQLSAAVARIDPVAAQEPYDAADRLRRSSPVSTRSGSELLGRCMALSIRALKPLMRQGLCTDEMMSRIVTLNDVDPCLSNRMHNAAELVIRAWCEGKADLASTIYTEQCQKILRSVDADQNEHLYRVLATRAAVAAYCFHKATAFSLLDNVVAPAHRESVLQSITLMVLRRIAPSEPWERIEDEFHKANNSTILDILEILKQTRVDSSFAICLSYACKVFGHKRNRDHLTRQQRAEFRHSVLKMIAEKLPDANNIQHEGYVVACKAYIARVVDTKVDEWKDLSNDAELVCNLADRAFVLLEICDAMPSKMIAERRVLLARCRTVIDSIPAIQDKMSRLEMYILLARQIDPAEAKAALRGAVPLTTELGAEMDASEIRRNLVDYAELIQDGFSDELADLLDDDPARQEAKEELKQAAEVKRLKCDLASSASSRDISKVGAGELSSAAWQNLTSLLADRQEALPPDRLLSYLERSGTFSLEESFPVVSWYLENLSKRFRTAREAEQFQVPAAEVTLLCSDLAIAMVSAQHRNSLAIDASLSSLTESSGSLIVAAGQREKATDYIAAWLRSNCSDEVVYCDPYFGHDDLEFLRYVLAANEAAKVFILTSKDGFKAELPTPSSLFAAWRSVNANQRPPETDVILVSNAPGKSPIHDRWIISGDAGLRVGTSFNSLGKKMSEISLLSGDEAKSLRSELGKFCSRVRYIGQERLEYLLVSI